MTSLAVFASTSCGSHSGPASSGGVPPTPETPTQLVTPGSKVVSGSGSVGASGGTITWPASGTLPGGSLTIPPGALTTTTTITVTAYDGGDVFGKDWTFYKLEPEGLVLQQPASISIGYRPEWVQRMGFDQSYIRAVHISAAPADYASAATVEAFPADSWNMAGNTATFSIAHFSILGIDFSPSVQVVQQGVSTLTYWAGQVLTSNPGASALVNALQTQAMQTPVVGTVLGMVQAMVFKPPTLGKPYDVGTCNTPCSSWDPSGAGAHGKCARNGLDPLCKIGAESCMGDDFWEDNGHAKFILIHGIAVDFKQMVQLGEHLKASFTGVGADGGSASNADVVYYDYPSGWYIKSNGYWLAKFISDGAKKNPNLKVNLVGFSMGGLVARSALELLPFDTGSENIDIRPYVANLITLNTPHQGSLVSTTVMTALSLANGQGLNYLNPGTLLLPPFEGIADLSPTSWFMQAVNGHGSLGTSGIPYYPMWTPQDNCVVIPKSSQYGSVMLGVPSQIVPPPGVPIPDGLAVNGASCTNVFNAATYGQFTDAHGGILEPCIQSPRDTVTPRIVSWVCNPPANANVTLTPATCNCTTQKELQQSCAFFDPNWLLVNVYQQTFRSDAMGLVECARVNSNFWNTIGAKGQVIQCDMPPKNAAPPGQCVPQIMSGAAAKCQGFDQCMITSYSYDYYYTNPSIDGNTFQQLCTSAGNMYSAPP